MSSLSRKLTEEVFKIINLTDQTIEPGDIVEELESYNLLEPLLELYYRENVKIPLVIHRKYSASIPIAVANIPLPEHRALIFYSPSTMHSIALSEGMVKTSLPVQKDAYTDVLLPSGENWGKEEERAREIEKLCRELGLLEPRVYLIEELIPYLPERLVNYLTSINPLFSAEVDREFLKTVQDFLKRPIPEKAKQRTLEFLRKFPGAGYISIYLGRAVLWMPTHLELNTPFSRNPSIGSYVLSDLTLSYNPDIENVIINDIGKCIVYQPSKRKHGYIIDMLPSIEGTKFQVEKEAGKREPLKLYAKYVVPHPVTGDELPLYLYKPPREKFYILLY